MIINQRRIENCATRHVGCLLKSKVKNLPQMDARDMEVSSEVATAHLTAAPTVRTTRQADKRTVGQPDTKRNILCGLLVSLLYPVASARWGIMVLR